MVSAFHSQEKQDPAPTLQLKGKVEDPASWLEVNGKLTFRAVAQNHSVMFVPLSSIVHERFSVYHEIYPGNS